MTREEIIQLLSLPSSPKITHKLFEEHEYVYTDHDNNLIDEGGYKLNKATFFQLRQSEAFQEGWYLFNSI